MGQLGAQTVSGHLQSMVASDPKKNNHLLEHCEGGASTQAQLASASENLTILAVAGRQLDTLPCLCNMDLSVV